MILAQGSEILHHVTPVTNDAKRISLIFGYAPANCFQPPKTNLRTMERVDTKFKVIFCAIAHSNVTPNPYKL